ncbi:protein of unknown function DUF72 [Geobacter metallireducens RCH3]|uniref:DUF72 domain-containing protein n=1 Tax=Geobacter metallireducens TaxID=28232 RepID=UPI000053BAAD|nr:DUF72 domain-containing protein [Geobacter metallireducens]EHP85232.1 protein of unknown function DUF72 [Geobacter metallireducens RCH3]
MGQMLRFYAQRLNALEINDTFYHMPAERVLAPWAEQVPDDFTFALKAPQVITHLKQLRNVEEEAGCFFRTLSVLGEGLGLATMGEGLHLFQARGRGGEPHHRP